MAMIEAIGLKKSFGKVEALRGVDLSVPQGGVCALLGPNGAGKTTAIRVLATLTPPDEGTARISGFDVVKEPKRVREAIGLAGQHAAVDDDLSGWENLFILGLMRHLGRRGARARATELLERFGLADAGDRLVKTWSGGMRRRLDLIASLVTEPEILFLDEPTTGLDPRSRAEVWSAVRELSASGTTILLTTQYLDEADHLADQIVIIDRGRVTLQGPPGELKDALARQGDAELIVRVKPGTVTQTELVRRLDGAGIEATDVSLRQPTLDEVFLAGTAGTGKEEKGAAA